MQKLLSIVIAAMFASVSFTAIAASHAGAAKDDKKMEKKAAPKADAKPATDAKAATDTKAKPDAKK